MTRWLSSERVAELQAAARKRGAARSPAIASRAARVGDTTHARLVLPFPPSVNHSGADGFRGGKKTDAYKAFVTSVAVRVVNAGSPRIEGRLSVLVEIVPPNARAFDLDNRLKATLDALQHAGVFADDAAIDDLRICRMPVIVPGEGGAVVTVHRIQ